MIQARGAVFNRARNTQVRDYSGLLYNKITPTDIDALTEYKNSGYIIIETKYGDAEMPFGQKLALERLCDDLTIVKPTLLIVTKHYFPSDIDIDMAKTQVVEYRFLRQWRKPPTPHTAKELSDKFIKYLDRQGEIHRE